LLLGSSLAIAVAVEDFPLAERASAADAAAEAVVGSEEAAAAEGAAVVEADAMGVAAPLAATVAVSGPTASCRCSAASAAEVSSPACFHNWVDDYSADVCLEDVSPADACSEDGL